MRKPRLLLCLATAIVSVSVGSIAGALFLVMKRAIVENNLEDWLIGLGRAVTILAVIGILYWAVSYLALNAGRWSVAEPVPALTVHRRGVEDGIEVQCPLCSFRRTFGTKQGATTKLTEHLLAEHRIRPIWRDAEEGAEHE